jgi:hypothetical protein
MTQDDWETFVGIVLGGIGLVALAKLLSEKKCPRCNGINPKDNKFCQYCGVNIK